MLEILEYSRMLIQACHSQLGDSVDLRLLGRAIHNTHFSLAAH